MKDPFLEIKKRCIVYYEEKSRLTPEKMAIEIMEAEGFVMHAPYHHCLVPAVLLTAACIQEDAEEEVFRRYLDTVCSRASKVPGAYCGEYGACGAALGEGIFASVWTGTSPHSKDTLGLVGQITGEGILEISRFSGPRCCKRCSFLAIEHGCRFAKEKLGIDLETEQITCTFYKGNEDCIHGDCCYFPGKKKD